MRNSIFIKIQPVPLLKQIEQRDRKSESHLEICPDSLPQMFEFADLREQRENGFNHHSVISLALRTNLQILGRIRFAPKTFVGKNNHFACDGFNQRQKLLIGNIGGFNLPISDESEFVDQKTEFAADYPLPRRITFFADSPPMRLMILPDRMTQLDAVRINHAENRRLGKKFLRQSAMRFQPPEKSGPLRQSRKQVNPISLEPAVKSPLRCAFESKQQSQSNQFTFTKFGLAMFQFVWQHIIYTAKKFYDKLFLSHGIGFLCVRFGHLHIRNFSVTFSTSTNG